MTDQSTDHRAEAEKWLNAAGALDDKIDELERRQVWALIGIGHALLAQDHDRCTATRGHANGHHWPNSTMSDFLGFVTRTFAGQPLVLSPDQAEALDQLIYDRNHPYGDVEPPAATSTVD